MFKIFNEYKDNIIKELGNDALDEDQIKKYCKENFSCFGGVYPHDEFKPVNNHCYVINTGNSKSAGYHWIGVGVSPHNIYFFDSYHRNIHKIIRGLDSIIGHRNVIVSKWPEPIQRDNILDEQNICGQLTLAWLQCVKNFGMRNAMLI